MHSQKHAQKQAQENAQKNAHKNAQKLSYFAAVMIFQNVENIEKIQGKRTAWDEREQFKSKFCCFV